MSILTNPIVMTLIIAGIIGLLIAGTPNSEPSKYAHKTAEDRAKEAMGYEYLKIIGVIILAIIISMALAYHDQKAEAKAEQEAVSYTETAQS